MGSFQDPVESFGFDVPEAIGLSAPQARWGVRRGEAPRSIMCLALEFLSGSRILLLKMYAQLRPAERRAGVENVRVHGCYHPGVPLLVDTTDNESPDCLTDARALRAALASALPGSPIAILVKPASGTSEQALTERSPVFVSRADALRWLAGWSVADVELVATDKNPTKRRLRPRRR